MGSYASHYGVEEVERYQYSRRECGFKEKPEALFAKDGERRKRVCVFCDAENHSSKDCSIVTDVHKRKKLLAQKKLCFNCTGSKHRAADCKSTQKCSKCSMKHHSSICTKKEKLRTANGKSDGLKLMNLNLI